MEVGIEYPGERRRHVAMPLGGIGTGNVSLSGTGALTQWEIGNQGNHLGVLPQSFFALRVSALEPPRSYRRILQAPAVAPGSEPAPLVNDDATAARYARPFAWPGVQGTRFRAAYPFAQIAYEDEWPIDVSLEAFTPFVPLDPEASGLPLASFSFSLANRFSVPLTGWLFGALQNAVGWDGATPIRDERCALLGGNSNTATPLAGGTAIVMTNPSLDPADPGFGGMALWTGAPSLALPQFDDADAALAFVSSLKLLAPLVLDDWSAESINAALATFRSVVRSPTGPSAPGRTWAGGLAAPFHIEPGETRTIELLIAWHFPNRYIGSDQFGSTADVPARPTWIGNHYSSVFAGAEDVVCHYVRHRETLRDESVRWRDALFGSSLPAVVQELLSAQPSLIRSPTTFRTADGHFFGFEGVLGESTLNWNANVGGSCPLNCTHVWNYEQAVSRLFPSLERSMRWVDWEVLQAPDGSLPHRVLLPLDTPQRHGRIIGGPDRAALDGMLGTILKTYREARQRGGHEWLEDPVPPHMRRLMAYVTATWDPAGSGVLRGDQPVTHDISLQGPNMFVGGLWLAALRVMQEALSLLGHDGEAADYEARFRTSSAAYDALLWNGEYYTQVSDGESFDFGAGCLADQLIGQWWAHQLGLGYLLPRDHVRTALSSIVRYNLRKGFRDFEHGYRVFADADDHGLLICTWPHGGRPAVPIRYADEVWTGVEYQVAAHCLFEDLWADGFELLTAVRSRYDGRRRNPYNEIECGDHYSRAMSGWSVLEAVTQASHDALAEHLRLGQRVDRYPLLAGTGWGEIHASQAGIELHCRRGEIAIRSLSIVDPAGAVAALALRDAPISTARVDASGRAQLSERLVVRAGDTLRIDLREV